MCIKKARESACTHARASERERERERERWQQNNIHENTELKLLMIDGYPLEL